MATPEPCQDLGSHRSGIYPAPGLSDALIPWITGLVIRYISDNADNACRGLTILRSMNISLVLSDLRDSSFIFGRISLSSCCHCCHCGCASSISAIGSSSSVQTPLLTTVELRPDLAGASCPETNARTCRTSSEVPRAPAAQRNGICPHLEHCLRFGSHLTTSLPGASAFATF